MSTKRKTLDDQGFLVRISAIVPDLVAVVGTYPICKCLRISLEPSFDIVLTDVSRAAEYVDLVVALRVILCPELECGEVETQCLLYLLVLLDGIEQMLLGPVVGMMFRDLFKELHTFTVPRDYEVAYHEFTVL